MLSPTNENDLGSFKRMQKVGCQTRGIYIKKTSQRIHVSPQQLILKSNTHFFMKLFLRWALTDSNRRPSACKADALNQLS